jgi:hypothetical protein
LLHARVVDLLRDDPVLDEAYEERCANSFRAAVSQPGNDDNPVASRFVHPDPEPASASGPQVTDDTAL